jgi:hypothetical protein
LAELHVGHEQLLQLLVLCWWMVLHKHIDASTAQEADGAARSNQRFTMVYCWLCDGLGMGGFSNTPCAMHGIVFCSEVP